MNDELREVLTPLGASVLFGKSGEAVRRAVENGSVQSPCALRFGERPIRLLDLESAIAFWHRSRPLEAALQDMRFKGITFAGQVQIGNDGPVKDDDLCMFRILHPVPLVERD